MPKYFSFQKLLNKLDKKLQTKELKTFCINAAQQPANFDDINYTIYNNKDGCYAWRPLQLLNPIIYVALTDDEQQKKSLKRKIRKDFYKVKQEMRLENYIINDLRFCK